MKDSWHSPKSIIFTREQCIWIIGCVLPLEPGIWPPEPVESGYTGGDKWAHSQRAPFESPCQITGELWARLSTTGEAGEALVDEIQYGVKDDRNIYYEDLSRPARRVLNYISGVKRRRQSYPEWKKYHKKFDQKGEYAGSIDNKRI